MEMFTGTLTTSRPLTTEELKEYGDVYSKSDDMYMTFVEGSPNELEGPCYSKVSRYVDMKKGSDSCRNRLYLRTFSIKVE
jgi:ureidoglycolate hydrolase